MYTSEEWGRPSGWKPRRKRRVAGVIAVLLALGFFGAWVANSHAQYVGRQRAAQTAWDQNIGRPAGVTVGRGQTVAIPATVSKISGYWEQCSFRECALHDIPHYPLVVPVWARYNGDCYTIKPRNRVSTLMVAATKSTAYTIDFSPDGAVVKICGTSLGKRDDRMVIWSPDLSASR